MAALKVMNLAMGRHPAPGKGVPEEDTPRLPIAHTTVEVICVLDTSQSDPVDYAFEQAIDQLAHFQTYYHLSTKTPVHRLTRKLLPPLLPIVRRSFSSPDEWEDGLFHVNNGGTMFLAASTPTMTAEQLQQMLDHNNASRAEIFKAFVLMRQEALLSYAAGSNSAASLFIAIAAETLLSELFLLMSWEEGENLETTAACLGERDNISKRLLSELAGRLKGDWDRSGEGTIGHWQRRVANLRNEVAHAGKIPSDAEIDSALDVLGKLDSFVGDQLAKSLKNYPFTSNIYLGREGFERRKKYKQWQEAAGRVEFPAHASGLFIRWKREVQRIRLGPYEGRVEESIAVVVMFGNGAERWYLVDEGRDLSCPIKAPEIDPGTRRNLDRIRKEKDFDVTSAAVDSYKHSAPLDPQWTPSYLVLPVTSINRWEQCLWVPPPSSTSGML